MAQTKDEESGDPAAGLGEIFDGPAPNVHRSCPAGHVVLPADRLGEPALVALRKVDPQLLPLNIIQNRPLRSTLLRRPDLLRPHLSNVFREQIPFQAQKSSNFPNRTKGTVRRQSSSIPLNPSKGKNAKDETFPRK